MTPNDLTPQDVLNITANPIYVGIPPFPTVIPVGMWTSAGVQTIRKLGAVPYITMVYEGLRSAMCMHFDSLLKERQIELQARAQAADFSITEHGMFDFPPFPKRRAEDLDVFLTGMPALLQRNNDSQCEVILNRLLGGWVEHMSFIYYEDVALNPKNFASIVRPPRRGMLIDSAIGSGVLGPLVEKKPPPSKFGEQP
jgi:hypothetical protein